MAITFRQASLEDVSAMAEIRARYAYTVGYWQTRIQGYLTGEHSPQKALAERVAFVAVEDSTVVGFLAGHSTRRFDCDGELEWIDVIAERQRRGIAGEMMALLAAWFIEQTTFRVCVNVAPDNLPAVNLYARHWAKPLNQYFMVWEDIRLDCLRSTSPLSS